MFQIPRCRSTSLLGATPQVLALFPEVELIRREESLEWCRSIFHIDLKCFKIIFLISISLNTVQKSVSESLEHKHGMSNENLQRLVDKFFN